MPRPTRINIFDTFLYWTVDNIGVPFCIQFNIHPNITTLCGFIPLYFQYLSILRCNRIGMHFYGAFNYWFDCLDGALARKTNKVTKIGGLLDTIHDFITAIVLLYFIEWRLPIVAVVVISYLIIYVFGKSVFHSHTPTNYHRIYYLVHDNLNIMYFITMN